MNFTLKCKYHDNCYRTRGLLPSNTAVLGELEPLSFLHAWQETPYDPTTSTKTNHRGENPSKADVQNFFNDNKEELQNLMTLLRT